MLQIISSVLIFIGGGVGWGGVQILLVASYYRNRDKLRAT